MAGRGRNRSGPPRSASQEGALSQGRAVNLGLWAKLRATPAPESRRCTTVTTQLRGLPRGRKKRSKPSADAASRTHKMQAKDGTAHYTLREREGCDGPGAARRGARTSGRPRQLRHTYDNSELSKWWRPLATRSILNGVCSHSRLALCFPLCSPMAWAGRGAPWPWRAPASGDGRLPVRLRKRSPASHVLGKGALDADSGRGGIGDKEIAARSLHLSINWKGQSIGSRDQTETEGRI